MEKIPAGDSDMSCSTHGHHLGFQLHYESVRVRFSSADCVLNDSVSLPPG